ncbi:hypothetical protein B0H11DRAFT_1173200 [Mycena galericulata]|nr:hypothetical protein B0H11DRAFT_1173200 [Mycena galericulata]
MHTVCIYGTHLSDFPANFAFPVLLFIRAWLLFHILFAVDMRSMIPFVPLCIALLSTVAASPLGDRALFLIHPGAPLARRFILSSRSNPYK